MRDSLSSRFSNHWTRDHQVPRPRSRHTWCHAVVNGSQRVEERTESKQRSVHVDAVETVNP
eukprot:3455541-Rhodomonas_salina.1